MSDDGPTTSAALPTSLQEMLRPSTSMTSSQTTTALLPQPDNVLFDPATIFRPNLPITSQPHQSTSLKTSVFSAGPSNRPVKRSTSSGNLPSPPSCRTTTAEAIPRKSLTSGLRSPPPLQKAAFSKRVFEAPSFSTEERPWKRMNTEQPSGDTSFKSQLPTISAVPSKQRLPAQSNKMSAVPQAGSAFSRAFATTKPNKDRTDSKLFNPPSLGSSSKFSITSKSNGLSKEASPSLPASTSFRIGSSLMPPSPVKTQPAAANLFNFGFTKPTNTRFDWNGAGSASFGNTSFALAPSPIGADEHVPRPLPEPVMSAPSRSASSTSLNSLNASPSRVQAAFGNPFLGLQQGRARMSAAASTTTHVPNSPPTLPTEMNDDLQCKQQGGSNVSPSRPSMSSSASPNARSTSPMQRDDLMRRTLEKNALASDAVFNSPVRKGDPVSLSARSDILTEEQKHSKVFAESRTSKVTVQVAPFAHHSPAQHLQSHQFLAPSVQAEPSALLPSSAIAYPGSPCKRPASPLQANDQNMIEERRIRQRKEDAASRTSHASSRRQSIRQAVRASSVEEKQTAAHTSKASDFSKPRSRPKSRQNSSEPEGPALQYRPASAGGSAPITRPISSRSISAPLSSMGQDSGEQADVFKAPMVSSNLPVRSKISADTTMDEGNSNENLDADTSIMSTSGLSSLANLQSLLSKMSRPSVSRRTSSAFSHPSASLSRLPEQAEDDGASQAEAESASSRTSMPVNREIAGLPRYAAPTSASNARLSKGSNGPLPTDRVPQDLATAKSKDTRRRQSNAASEVRRGSLLPMAVNAAQRLTVRPDAPTATATHGKQDVPTLKVSKVEKCQVLKDVVAFVDVKTAEGDEAGGVFVDILRGLGARVLARPTDSITHIIFKGGRPATVQRYRAYTKEPKPFFIGVGWVVRCREGNEKADESAFLVNPDSVDSNVLLNAPGMGQKRAMQPLAASSGNVAKGLGNRRQTLEPKVLFPDPNKRMTSAPRGQLTLHAFKVFRKDEDDQDEPSKQGEIERARQRSLKFAPRIGSPLKQRVYIAIEQDEDTMQEDC